MANSDLLRNFDAQHAWNDARRNAVVQRVLCALEDCSYDLIPFEEARKKLHLNQKICLGLQEIEIAKIRGSVGRYDDFTSAFLPRHDNLRDRWLRVRSAREIKGLPPIELYKVGEAYFVSDGNHRVSTAKQEGMETIEAYVCEYVSPVVLTEEADRDEVLIKAEYLAFLKRTKLRPEHKIEFTVPGRYMEVECQIQTLQQSLAEERGETVTYGEAALEWYEEIYLPTIDEIKESGAIARFPGRTLADLFIWMWRKEPELQIYCAPTEPTNTDTEPTHPFRRLINRLFTLVRKTFSLP